MEPLVDIRILKTNHSLFSARVVPELGVAKGGTLVNAEGQTGEKGTFGVASPWCDYYGTRAGVTEGLAILQHPGNRWYPAKWFTRDYGFFSPTPMYWLEGDQRLPKGQKLTLSYRVVVHSGDTQKAGIAAIFDAYKRTEGQPPTTPNVHQVACLEASAENIHRTIARRCSRRSLLSFWHGQTSIPVFSCSVGNRDDPKHVTLSCTRSRRRSTGNDGYQSCACQSLWSGSPTGRLIR